MAVRKATLRQIRHDARRRGYDVVDKLLASKKSPQFSDQIDDKTHHAKLNEHTLWIGPCGCLSQQTHSRNNAALHAIGAYQLQRTLTIGAKVLNTRG